MFRIDKFCAWHKIYNKTNDLVYRNKRKIESLLTSIVRPYSFIITDRKGVQYRRDVHVAQHTAAAATSVNKQVFHTFFTKINILKL